MLRERPHSIYELRGTDHSMPSFDLYLDLGSSYVGDAPMFEVLLDGVVVSSFTVGAGFSPLTLSLSYAGDAPNNLSFRFNDFGGEVDRSVTINEVRINTTPVAVGSLSKGVLLQGQESQLDVAAEQSSFGIPGPSAGTDALINGTAGVDVLNGTAGNDTINGLGDRDWIKAGGGIDTVNGGDGHDIIRGGTGNDILNGDDGQDIVRGEDGDDTLTGGLGHDTLFGGIGADDLSGNDGNDVLHGDAGIDTLRGGNNNDKIFGGTEGDFIYGDAGNDKLLGEDGNDTIYGGAGLDNLNGGNGNDILDTEADNDRAYGGAGMDTLYGRGGNDLLDGGADNDTIFGGDDNDRIFGGTGDDTLNGEDGNDRIVGGDGVDTIDGGDGIDNIDGNDGNDILNGGLMGDLIKGGDGDDTLNGGDGNDNLYGQFGNDTINGGNDDDFIYGRTGNNTLNGDAGNDTIHGGEGNDIIDGGIGTDIINAEDGNDQILAGAEGEVLRAGAGADTVDGGGGDDIIHGHGLAQKDIDVILAANPSVTYNASSNSFYQYVNSGVNHATAEAAAQGAMLNGVAGHLANITSAAENTYVQSLITGTTWISGTDVVSNTDWVWSGGAEDGIQFSSGATAVNNLYENWAGGQPQNNAEHNAVIYTNGTWHDWPDTSSHRYVIEWDAGLMNSDNAVDVIDGGAGNDTIYGYGGNDILNGDANDDLIFGGNGNDNIDGGSGNDALFGQDGDDTINGGTGNDTLYGDSGEEIPSVADQISTLLADNAGLTYSAATGNFYMHVETNFTWGAARTNAQTTLINGVGGYLTNITSAAENTHVASLLSGDAWIGGTDGFTEGEWIWVDGPEAGQQFWSGTASGSSVGGFYENWNSGEPNQSGNEDGAEINNGGGWNDQGATASQDSVIEWNGSDLIQTPTASGQDILNGGDGDDTLYGGADNDILNGGNNNDTLYGGFGNDTLDGGANNDTLFGDIGVDNISGGDGDDIIYGDRLVDVGAPTASENGWYYEYYDLTNTPSNLATAGFTLNGGRDNTNTPAGTGITLDTDPNTFDGGSNYALKFTTTLTINTGGTYTFRTRSDDGSMLFLDGTQIVDNDGLHGAVTVTSAGQVLAAGTYLLEATFFERGGGEVMEITMAGPDTGGSSTYINLENYVDVNVTTLGSTITGDTISGGAGTDTLYGGIDADTFVFEAASAFAQTDSIMDFSQIDGDAIDISDIVTGFSGTITDYVQFSISGSDTLVQVDANGLTGGSSFQTIASLDNITGLDVTTLYNAGQIVV